MISRLIKAIIAPSCWQSGGEECGGCGRAVSRCDAIMQLVPRVTYEAVMCPCRPTRGQISRGRLSSNASSKFSNTRCVETAAAAAMGCCSEQFEVVQLVPILHDVSLDLAANGPSHKVLELAGHQKGRVCDGFRSNSDMALLDHLGSSLLHTYLATHFERL